MSEPNEGLVGVDPRKIENTLGLLQGASHRKSTALWLLSLALGGGGAALSSHLFGVTAQEFALCTAAGLMAGPLLLTTVRVLWRSRRVNACIGIVATVLGRICGFQSKARYRANIERWSQILCDGEEAQGRTLDEELKRLGTLEAYGERRLRVERLKRLVQSRELSVAEQLQAELMFEAALKELESMPASASEPRAEQAPAKSKTG